MILEMNSSRDAAMCQKLAWSCFPFLPISLLVYGKPAINCGLVHGQPEKEVL